ncbi:TPA: hypothetical protein ACFK4W_11705 [Neisseria gonorrhoeae]
MPQKCRLKLSDGIFIKCKTPCACRYVVISMQAGMTGFEIAVLSDGFRDYGVVGNDGSGILLRPPRACKRQVHQKCRLKVQTASVSGNQKR